MKPRFFKTAAAFRTWMMANHGRASEVYVGFYKKDSGNPSVTYHEALDEALAVGWIDGVRKGFDSDSYVIRFTPRKRGSYWSRVNIARALALQTQNRMTPAGTAAFEARDESRTARYSFERASASFDRGQQEAFEADARGWAFFQAQPPGYRKVATFWVVSAKRDETRARRLQVLIRESARGRRLSMLTPQRKR